MLFLFKYSLTSPLIYMDVPTVWTDDNVFQ